MPTSEPISPERAGDLLALAQMEFEAAVDSLVQTGADAVPLLQRLEETARSRQQSKLARRGLHRLRSRGIASAQPARIARRTTLRRPARDPDRGVVSQPDPLGRRALFLVAPSRAGADLYEVLLSDVDGVLAATLTPTRRREARAFLRELREHAEKKFLEIPCEELCALVARAWDRRAEPLAAGVDQAVVAALLERSGAATPGERLRTELAERSERLPVAEAEATLREQISSGGLLSWPVEPGAVAELAAQLEEIEESPLVLPAAQTRERSTELMEKSAAAVFGRDVRERWSARLEETAVFVAREGDERGACAALRVAQQIREVSSPLEVGFLRDSLDMTLHAAQEKLAADRSGNLIVSS